ncbi:hypothetical protein GOODEAATRI_010523, partial [Goodea atripinnis]
AVIPGNGLRFLPNHSEITPPSQAGHLLFLCLSILHCQLKSQLVSPYVLANFDLQSPTFMTCDAFSTVVSTILSLLFPGALRARFVTVKQCCKGLVWWPAIDRDVEVLANDSVERFNQTLRAHLAESLPISSALQSTLLHYRAMVYATLRQCSSPPDATGDATGDAPASSNPLGRTTTSHEAVVWQEALGKTVSDWVQIR